MSFYAVKEGREQGIHSTWNACKMQVHSYPNTRYKKLSTKKDEEAFIRCNPVSLTSSSKKKQSSFFYAVKEGRKPGIYNTWSECEEQVKGFYGARYKKFPSKEQAEAFVKNITLPIPTMEEDERIIVFTDGACINNGRTGARASYAFVFPHHPSLNDAFLLEGTQTNNRAEYNAVIHAYEVASKLDDRRPIHIYSDSKLLVNFIHSLPRSLHKFKNQDLCERLVEIVKEGRLHIFHVRAHTGKYDFFSYWNYKVDRMANGILG